MDCTKEFIFRGKRFTGSNRKFSRASFGSAAIKRKFPCQLKKKSIKENDHYIFLIILLQPLSVARKKINKRRLYFFF
jgi:hypothetical protein